MADDLKNLTNEKYNIDNLCYPDDLLAQDPDGSNKYGHNCIAFHINVQESSKFLRKDKSDIVEDFFANNTNASGRLANNNTTVKEAGLAIFTAGVATAITTSSVKPALIGTLLGEAGVAALNSTQGNTFTRSLKRLKSTIVLHAPNAYMSRYGTQWAEEATDIFQMGYKGPEALWDAIKNAPKAPPTADDSGWKQTQSTVAAIALKMIPGKDALSAMTGKAANPKKEQIFGGVDFRSFFFEYQFFPRSPEEYNNIKNIIKLFKMHMHPEYYDKDNFLFVYPSEFDIEHLNSGVTNENLPKHESCVLTEMNVNYSPNAQFASFENGVPIQINVTMTFRELSILTKQRVDQGY